MNKFNHIKKWMVVPYEEEINNKYVTNSIQNNMISDQEKINLYNNQLIKNNLSEEKNNFVQKIEPKVEPSITWKIEPDSILNKSVNFNFDQASSDINTSQPTKIPEIIQKVKQKRKADQNLSKFIDVSVIANRTRKRINGYINRKNLDKTTAENNNFFQNLKVKPKPKNKNKSKTVIKNWDRFMDEKTANQKELDRLEQDFSMFQNDKTQQE